ncbi:EAL domain-containing protein [Photobacterium sanctipauli]|uniref:EAL domain-containing protein n=1 Tax=Photobacterium sanctipauli TaxID=1342794 RepID=A0A2T3NPR6_9GAMM|nr:EAL domain-containing protein [Photobacterium sanctipauli]PSW18212.1 EAL domain-containing protein [Photobacterium sanctipauli]
MTKLSNILHNKLVITSIGLILLPLIVTTLIYPVLTWSLETKYKTDITEELKRTIFKQSEITYQQIQKLSYTLKTCDPGTQAKITDLERANFTIDYLGWINNDKTICTSRPYLNNTKYNNKFNVTSRQQWFPDAFLLEVKLLKNHFELAIVTTAPDKTVYAALDLRYLASSIEQCSNCLMLSLPSSDAFQYVDSKIELGGMDIGITFIESNVQHYINNKALTVSLLIALTASLLSTLLIIRLFRRKSFYNELKEAISKSQVKPYFQPIMNSKTRRIHSAEVLARWIVAGKVIPPAQFIPLAESSGLIDDLFFSLYQQTVQYKLKHPEVGNTIYAFNVTPSQIERPSFINKLIAIALFKNELNIAIEITEREPFKDIPRVKRYLKLLSAAGITIKLDDAGTGYGSFSYVQELGFNVLKIDRLFVDTVGKKEVSNEVLEGIIKFSKTANLTMVAEGVETQEQVNYLNQFDVYLHQGYFYAPPLSADDFLHFIRSSVKEQEVVFS